ncbi:hypothetical protein BpHYR1_022243 [Brachionus plicatilis]|uniref:Uncharacterized protein n=1 Tax=Brachionus plicatilis TaxID=10195 RepID=A0A3M7T5J6_BRAPC|nr:hypothetical protein BpHYR1_022243 [Brachionus plicatilis]
MPQGLQKREKWVEVKISLKISFKASVPRQIWIYAMQHYPSRIIKPLNQSKSSNFNQAIIEKERKDHNIP